MAAVEPVVKRSTFLEALFEKVGGARAPVCFGAALQPSRACTVQTWGKDAAQSLRERQWDKLLQRRRAGEAGEVEPPTPEWEEKTLAGLQRAGARPAPAPTTSALEALMAQERAWAARERKA